jgi:quercetin dioxygenase-like cupin family protein
MQNEVSGKTRARARCVLLSGANAASLLAGIIGLVVSVEFAAGENGPRKGFSAFGPDQTIADASRLEWAPLKLEGLAPGAEIAVLRGDLATGPSELLLQIPPNFTVPNHTHSSDEAYVWLKGSFTYIADDGREQDFAGQAFIGLPPKTPHALRCGNEPCLFYLRYSSPFDWHLHPMPKKASPQ